MHSLRLCVSLLQHAEGRALATKLLACQTPAFVSCSPQQPAHGPSNGAFQGKKHPRHTKWHVDLSCISNAMVVTAGAAAGGWPPAHASFHTTAGLAAEDYYTILGLSKGASDQDIKRSFYKLAKKYHPDTNKDDPAAAKRFQEVNRAYQTLRDPEKRAMYDRLGREAMERMEAEGGDASSSGPGGPGGGPGFSAEDIFNMFARGGMGGAGGGRGGFGMFMNSFMMEETVRITLEEAISGVQRTVKVQVNPYGPPLTVPITIPPGVDTGMGLQEQVSLGQVHLLLTVRIEVLPHRTFRRTGDDLNVDVDISLVDALLGGHVDVPTLSGVRPITVPACSLNQDVLILPGYGVPRLSSLGRGSLKVHLRVKKPKGGLTERQRHLLVEFEREEANKSRGTTSSTTSSSSRTGASDTTSSSSSSRSADGKASHLRESPFGQGGTTSEQWRQQQPDHQGQSGASSSSTTGSSSSSSSQQQQQQGSAGASTSSGSSGGSSNTAGGGSDSSSGSPGWFEAAKSWFKPPSDSSAGGSGGSSGGGGDDAKEKKRRAKKSGGS